MQKKRATQGLFMTYLYGRDWTASKRETESMWYGYKKVAELSRGRLVAPVFSSVVVVLVAEFGISSFAQSLYQIYMHCRIYKSNLTLEEYC